MNFAIDKSFCWSQNPFINKHILRYLCKYWYFDLCLIRSYNWLNKIWILPQTSTNNFSFIIKECVSWNLKFCQEKQSHMNYCRSGIFELPKKQCLWVAKVQTEIRLLILRVPCVCVCVLCVNERVNIFVFLARLKPVQGDYFCSGPIVFFPLRINNLIRIPIWIYYNYICSPSSQQQNRSWTHESTSQTWRWMNFILIARHCCPKCCHSSVFNKTRVSVHLNQITIQVNSKSFNHPTRGNFVVAMAGS